MSEVIGLKLPSPIEQIRIEGRDYYLKRDDLIHPDFSGNKARKLLYWLRREFPHIRKLISYGSPQSNAMYSLSILAKVRAWEFHYYVDHIPSYLLNNPIGNYKGALENGTLFHKMSKLPKEPLSNEYLFIHEGGHQKEAQEGIMSLAQEILAWKQEQGIDSLTVFLPSGTGTTALYLQKSFKLIASKLSVSSIQVVTVPCVGSVDYLCAQFAELESNSIFWPQVIDLDKKYHFGKLYREFYQVWLELYRQTGVRFELLYDPKGWLTLLEFNHRFDGEVLYLHQGGLKGNESMLPRYRRRYPDLELLEREYEDILQQR